MNYSDDHTLITAALTGDRESLNLLLLRHRPYIYNIALKMINHVADAEDVTQEILIKVITNLGSFDRAKGRFTTWLYRIVVNHVLKLKTQKYEYLVGDFGDFFTAIGSVEDEPLTASEEAELSRQIEESKLACMSGMLMCLDRPQRIVFILGALFGIEHTLGGEVLEISPANFRQRLARARKDLYHWMHQRCGLVNTDNPCRCPKKTRGFIRAGWVDPAQPKWNSDYVDRIRAHTASELDPTLAAVDRIYDRLYRDHPFKIARSKADIVEEILGDAKLNNVFGLN